MKKLIIILLTILIGAVASAQGKRGLLLTYQGHGSYNGCGVTPKDIPGIRENMEFLIKKGYLPILIEGDWEVIWLYLDNPNATFNRTKIDFESDYINEIHDLLCIKTDEKIKTLLKEDWNNKKVLKLLGIKYKTKNDEVTSKVKPKKLKKYL